MRRANEVASRAAIYKLSGIRGARPACLLQPVALKWSFASKALQYFPDRLAAPGEMARVLSPGGLLSLNVWGPVVMHQHAGRAARWTWRCGQTRRACPSIWSTLRGRTDPGRY